MKCKKEGSQDLIPGSCRGERESCNAVALTENLGNLLNSIYHSRKKGWHFDFERQEKNSREQSQSGCNLEDCISKECLDVAHSKNNQRCVTFSDEVLECEKPNQITTLKRESKRHNKISGKKKDIVEQFQHDFQGRRS